ncbi:MAG: dihydroorotate dehydrogenase [Candidatus Omnitrophota bacterium]
MNLKVNLGKLKLKNPVLVASGTFGYAKEFSSFLNLKELGGIVTKTITLKPRSGNKPPRLVETPAGLLNSIGLQNEGLDYFMEKQLPEFKKIGIPIIVSLGAEEIEEYAILVKKLEKISYIDAFELNISCPNVKDHNVQKPGLIAQDPQATYEVVKLVRRLTKKPLITKLSPNVTDIVLMAQAAANAGTDILSLVNTFFGMSVDIHTRKPKLANIVGGLSGPAIKPMALQMTWQLRQNLNLPIIAMGGIMNAEDALEFLITGADAICVGTANLINPKTSTQIIKDLKEYLLNYKINQIKEITSSLLKNS